ncbi:hypothetical protein BGZ83_007427 [Gryganskiella cystojenkinii]|nr:hypothetical protein BGZ83_007427 [Gryganskiella cystojenkinii]
MQRDDEEINMPGGFKSNRADASHINNNINHTGSVAHSNTATGATTMRAANTINPHGSAFEVAGPTVGGAPSPYSSDRLEQAKERLAGSLHGTDQSADYNNNTLNVSGSGNGHARRPSLTDTVLSSASSAANGAAAAGASVIAAAKKLIHHGEDEHAPVHHYETTTATTIAHPDTVSSASAGQPASKAMHPGDRAPLKVSVHAMKPSDKATYGNLDSPGAATRHGPLSERALAGTIPVTEQPRTIADPFGPVKVSNWNDGHREQDVSTPKAEDFDTWLDSPRSQHIVKSFTAPGAVSYFPHAPAHKASPLKNGSTGSTEHAPDAADHAHSSLRNQVGNVPAHVGGGPTHAPAFHHNAKAGATLAALGSAAAMGTTAGGTHHTSMAPAPVAYSYAGAPSTTIPIAQPPVQQYHHEINPNAQQIPIAQPPVQQYHHGIRPIAQQIPIAQPPAEYSHPTQTSTNSYYTQAPQMQQPQQQQQQHHNVAPKAAAATFAAGTAAVPLAMHSSTHSATTASVQTHNAPSAHVSSHDQIAKDTTHQFAITQAATLLAQQEYAAKQHSRSVPIQQQQQPIMHSSSAVPVHHASAAAPALATATAIPVAVAAASHHQQSAQHLHHNTPIVRHAQPIMNSSSNNIVHANVAPTSSSTSTTAKIAAPVVAASAGTAAGVAAYLHKKDEVRSNVVDTTLPAAPREHQAYLASNGDKTSNVHIQAAPVALQKNVTPVAHHHATAVPVASTTTTTTHTGAPAVTGNVKQHVFTPIGKDVRRAAAPAAAPVFNTKYMKTTTAVPVALPTATTTRTVIPAVTGNVKQYVFTPIDKTVRKAAAPVPAPVFNTKYMNTTTAAAPAMQKVTTATTTIQDQAHKPLAQKMSAPVVGAAAVAGAATGAANYMSNKDATHHSTTTTQYTTASTRPAEHLEYTLKPSGAHPITSASTTTTVLKDSSTPVVTPYTASTTTTTTRPNPVLSAPRPVIPGTTANVNTSKTTTTTTTVPSVQQHTTTVNAPSIPVVNNNNYTTATRTASAAVPVVAAAAVTGYQKTATTSTTTPNYNAGNTGYYNQNIAAPSAPALSSSSFNTSSTTTTNKNATLSSTDIERADNIAAAIPEAYHGPLPQVHPGEEIVWVKTTTTTEVYEDGTPVGIMDGNNDGYQGTNNGNINNNSNQQQGYYNNQQQQTQQPVQEGAGGRRGSNGSLVDRMMGRGQTGADKGKGRM